jgi:hypothetical protein
MLQEYSEEHSEQSRPILWQQVMDALQYSSDQVAYSSLLKFVNQGCKDENGFGLQHRKNSIHNDTLMTVALKRRNLVKTCALLHQVSDMSLFFF